MILPYIMEIELGCVKGCGCFVARNKLYFFGEPIRTTRIESKPYDSGKLVVKSAVTSVQGETTNTH